MWRSWLLRSRHIDTLSLLREALSLCRRGSLDQCSKLDCSLGSLASLVLFSVFNTSIGQQNFCQV